MSLLIRVRAQAGGLDRLGLGDHLVDEVRDADLQK